MQKSMRLEFNSGVSTHGTRDGGYSVFTSSFQNRQYTTHVFGGIQSCKKLKRPHAGKLVPSLVRVFTHLDMFPKSSETDWKNLKSAVSVHFRHSVFHRCQMPNTNPAHPRPDLVHICLTSPSTWGISPTVEVSAPRDPEGLCRGQGFSMKLLAKSTYQRCWNPGWFLG